jgi:hypothetical protein
MILHGLVDDNSLQVNTPLSELPMGICGGCGEPAMKPDSQICQDCENWLYSEDFDE